MNRFLLPIGLAFSVGALAQSTAAQSSNRYNPRNNRFDVKHVSYSAQSTQDQGKQPTSAKKRWKRRTATDNQQSFFITRSEAKQKWYRPTVARRGPYALATPLANQRSAPNALQQKWYARETTHASNDLYNVMTGRNLVGFGNRDGSVDYFSPHSQRWYLGMPTRGGGQDLLDVRSGKLLLGQPRSDGSTDYLNPRTGRWFITPQPIRSQSPPR